MRGRKGERMVAGREREWLQEGREKGRKGERMVGVGKKRSKRDKFHFLSANEHCVSAKEPYVSIKRDAYTKKPYISTKKRYVSVEEKKRTQLSPSPRYICAQMYSLPL